MTGRKTLLLLGASGFLGARILSRARSDARDFEVVATCGPGPNGKRPPGPYRTVDLADEDAVADLLADVSPAIVVNAAALSRVDRCEQELELAARLNTRLPRMLAQWTSAHGRRCLHVSTDLVFGGAAPPGRGFRESDSAEPLHAYGRSKLAGEEGVLAAAPEALVVRLPLLYGDSLGRGLGASDGLLAALGRGERPGLFTDEWRTPLDVGVAAEALLELLETPTRGLLHVAGAARLTRYELGILCLRRTGRSTVTATESVRSTTRRAAGMEATRARDVSLDSSAARRVLRTPLPGPPGWAGRS